MRLELNYVLYSDFSKALLLQQVYINPTRSGDNSLENVIKWKFTYLYDDVHDIVHLDYFLRYVHCQNETS